MAKGMHKPTSLARRQAAFAEHGATPGNGKQTFKRPGSNKK